MITIEKAKEIWNSFSPEARDMQFEDFYKELQDLADPHLMQRDLTAVRMLKANEVKTKTEIDKVLKNG